jgi:hypothetical protein
MILISVWLHALDHRLVSVQNLLMPAVSASDFVGFLGWGIVLSQDLSTKQREKRILMTRAGFLLTTSLSEKQNRNVLTFTLLLRSDFLEQLLGCHERLRSTQLFR